ncbi:hypothetical protein D3C76_1494010 [compost metagenome]
MTAPNSLLATFHFGIERIAQTISHQIEAERGEQDAQARKQHRPWRRSYELA